MVEECRKKTEYRSQKTGVRIQKTGDRSLNGGSRILDSGFWMLPKPRRGKDRMVKVSTIGKAGGLISPKRAALLATLKGYPSLGITL